MMKETKKDREKQAKMIKQELSELYNNIYRQIEDISETGLMKRFLFNLPEDFYVPFIGKEELTKIQEFMDSYWANYITIKDKAELIKVSQYAAKTLKEYINKEKNKANDTQLCEMSMILFNREWKRANHINQELKNMTKGFDMIDYDNEVNSILPHLTSSKFSILSPSDFSYYKKSSAEEREEMREEIKGMRVVIEKEIEVMSEVIEYLKMKKELVRGLDDIYSAEIEWINHVVNKK